MNNQDLQNKVKLFCTKKNFTHPFFQECIIEFIEGHTNLYGDIISEKELFERLDENLDKITFAGQRASTIGILGEYKSRISEDTENNEILLFFNESDLKSPEYTHRGWNIYTSSDKSQLLQEFNQKRELIKTTLIHELTHAAYTIKDKYSFSEAHVFSTTAPSQHFKEMRQISGTNTFVEPIINYISNRIQGKTPDELLTYKAETKAIHMLAEKMDEKKIIKSSWNSDLEQFQNDYINSLGFNNVEGKKRFDKFHKLVAKLGILNTRDISLKEKLEQDNIILSKIYDVFDSTKELENTKLTHLNSPSIDKNLETPLSSLTPYKPPTIFQKIITSIKSKFKNIKSSIFTKNNTDEIIESITPLSNDFKTTKSKSEPLPPWDLRNWSEKELKASAEQGKKEYEQKSNLEKETDDSFIH